MTVRISVSRIHFPVTTLGPGRRLGIWFQGCSIRCPGCISMDTWAEGRGNTTVEEVVNSIIPWISKADGITISGGEPFDQPDALLELTARIRSKTEADILVFTGYPWAYIRDMVGTSAGYDRCPRYGAFRLRGKADTCSARKRQSGTSLHHGKRPRPVRQLRAPGRRAGSVRRRHVRRKRRRLVCRYTRAQ